MGFNVGLNLDNLIPTTTNVGELKSGTSGTTTSGTKLTSKSLNTDALNQIIYSILSSDQGLASIGTMENLVGGSASSSKTLQTQDFLAKVIGELANVTAVSQEVLGGSSNTTTTSEGTTTQKKRPTVICTELARQGKLPRDLYDSGAAYQEQLHPYTYRGYISWATHVVPKLQKSERLSKILAPVVVGRYKMIVHRVPTFWGLVTIYVGQPICFVIGALLALGDKYGRARQSA